MSRPRRLDFHGAIHIVHMRGREGFNIFFDPAVLLRTAGDRWRNSPRVLRFLQFLDACCSECGVQLFGYCVEPNECWMLLRTFGAPLDACMQRLGGRYSRYLHAEKALSVNAHPFAARYAAKVLAPEYLPHALRRLHAHPLKSGLARRAVDYPFSSAQSYLGERSRAHLEMDPLWKALQLKGLSGLRGYREFMERAESPHVSELFERGSAMDVRVIGSKTFVQQARDAARHPPPRVTKELLIASVTTLLSLQKEELFEASHQAVLGRALVAWYALRFGAGSLREVAGWFGVSGAALGKGIRHYRRITPNLFAMHTLPGIEIADNGIDI